MGKNTILVVAGSRISNQVEDALKSLTEIEYVHAVTAAEVASAVGCGNGAVVLVEDSPDFIDFVVGRASADESQGPPVLFLGCGGEGAGCKNRFSGSGFVEYVDRPFEGGHLATTVDLLLQIHNLHEQLATRKVLLEDKNLEIEVLQQELEEKSNEIAELSSLDGLTGLFNRYYFDDNLHKEWRQAVRKNDSLSLLFIDVDYLKEYNAEYGREAGDLCLQELARALHQTLLRPVDIVARYGGDQFAAILPATEEPGAIQVATRMMEQVAALELSHKSSPAADCVTISIGVATLRPDNRDKVAEFLHTAERALVAAKNAGRNCLRVG